jgi:nitronate monooxygenase
MVGVNIMRYIDRYYADSVLGAIDGGAHFIASGAGLPLELPKIVGNADIAIIPIVSSVRALKNICKRWGRTPDAVIVEGPLAGGHLGFKYDTIFEPDFQLENIFPPIKDYALRNNDFPVIVAGGIRVVDIPRWILEYGADGVQLGTIFLASHESTANEYFKQNVVTCTEQDILIAMPHRNPPGSPSGMPFRVIKKSPMFICGSERKNICELGYVLQKDSATGKHTQCLAKTNPAHHFCICTGLLAATQHPSKAKPLWTVGAHAHEITQIRSVDQIIDEIIAQFP